LDDPSTQLVFVGFQAEGTLGREIKEGKKELSIWGKNVEMRAQIKEIKTMSSHADQGQLISWLGKIKGLKKVVLTHGEELQRLVLKEKIRQEIQDVEVYIPNLDDEIEL
jgi:metallo-beta-lactamase family protein